MMDQDANTLNQIALLHGQARWVLRHFNMSAGDTDEAFNAFLKSLRLGGVPFSLDELGGGTGRNILYRFHHLMELALALAFRTQGILPRYFVGLIADNRKILRHFFRQAYLERQSGLGAWVDLYVDPDASSKGDVSRVDLQHLTKLSGTFLSLSLIEVQGGLALPLEFRLVGPAEAVSLYTRGHMNLYPRPPLPLSDMAVDIIKLSTSPQLPDIRRGRP